MFFVSDRDLVGDLIDNERFVLACRSALDSLHSRGALATLKPCKNTKSERKGFVNGI